MKTRRNIFLIHILFISLATNAQLKVLSTGRVEVRNQAAIYSDASNPTDGIDIVGLNQNLATGIDLIWGYYAAYQSNNAGLFTLQSKDGAYFTVRANGKVGIFNNNPGEALEVGTPGTNYQVKINGNLVLTSDERAKENITDLASDKEKIKKLRGVSYNLKPVVEKTTTTATGAIKDINGVIKPTFEPISDKKHAGRKYYGFLAQEIELIYPDLVYKDSTGIRSVDYIGLIPLIVRALNDQTIEIDALKEKIRLLEVRMTKIDGGQPSGPKKVTTQGGQTIDDVNPLTYPVLDQNIPNPFNAATTIGYYLPSDINEACIYVYDMNGVQQKKFPISERGKGNLIIQGATLQAGMYLYALISDGKVIDTKRMILTK
jgi:hypothetical protein